MYLSLSEPAASAAVSDPASSSSSSNTPPAGRRPPPPVRCGWAPTEGLSPAATPSPQVAPPQGMKAGPRLLKKNRKSSSPFATARRSASQPHEDLEEYQQQQQPPSVWNSSEDLRRPNTGHTLRDQLTGELPESVSVLGTPSHSGSTTPTATNMPFRNRSAKRADLRQVAEVGEAISSTSSVDSSGLKKLADKAEKDITTVDVEQAVTLLEELKKVATPEQLVSLHKALLPTKEVETVANPAHAQSEEQLPSRLVRQRSNLPPGLATRGGASTDPLRKLPSSIKLDTATPRRKDASDDSWISPMPSIDSISNPKSNLRAITPIDEPYLHAGAFGHGTLRITNGYASPDPSIYGDHIDAADNKTDEGYLTSSEKATSIAEGRPLSRQDLFDAMAQAMSPVRNKSPETAPRDRQVSMEDPTPVEPLRVRERAWPAPESIPEMAKRMQMQQPSEIAKPPVSPPKFRGFQERCSPADVSPLTSPDLENLAQRANSAKYSNDDVSPVSDRPIPRYQERWSQRMADISNMNMARPDLSVRSPEGEDSTLLNFRSRLSVVNDVEWDSDEEGGDVATPQPRTALHTPRADESNYAHSANTSPQDEDAPNIALQSTYKEVMHELEIRTGCSKHDSGYASDDPPASLKKNQISDRSETSTLADGQSVYNLQEFLNAAPTKPRAPGHARSKSAVGNEINSPFIRIEKPALNTNVAPSPSPEDRSMLSPLSPTSQSRLNMKGPKKLTKPMPANVRAKMQIGIDTRVQKARTDSASSPIPPVSPEATESLRLRAVTSPHGGNPQSLEEALLQGAPHSVNPTPEEMKRESYFDSLKSPPEQKGESYFSAPAAIQAQRMRPRSKTSSTPSGTTPPADPPLRTQRSSVMTHIRNISGGLRWSSRELKKEPSFTKSPDDELPEHVDLGTVGRTLGSGSYDIATPKQGRDGLQAPRQTSSGHERDPTFNKSNGPGSHMPKHKSMMGMNETAAMELARMRSRDLPGAGMNPIDERPHMAIPRRRAETTVTPPSNVRVEDRFPDWQGKPLVHQNNPGARDAQYQQQNSQMAYNRPNSLYAESVPSMPDVPTNANDLSLRADEKLMEHRQQFMAGTARGPRPPPQGGHTMIQKATRTEAMMLEERERPQSSPIPDPRYLAATKEADRLRQWQEWRLSLGFSPMDGEEERENEHYERDDDLESELRANSELVPDVPGAQQPTVQQQPSRPQFTRTHTDPTSSPAIVVSRYITPIGSENARPTDTAAQHADAYRDLLDDGMTESPVNMDPNQHYHHQQQQQYRQQYHQRHQQDPSACTPQRADSANSLATSIYSQPQSHSQPAYRPQTAHQTSIPYKGGPAWQGAASAGPYTTTFASAASSAHATGSWVPFSPANHAAMAERARACSMSATQAQRPTMPHPPTAAHIPNAPIRGHARAESAMPAYGGTYTNTHGTGTPGSKLSAHPPRLPSPPKPSERSTSPTRGYFDPRAAHAKTRSAASTPSALMGSICGGGVSPGGLPRATLLHNAAKQAKTPYDDRTSAVAAFKADLHSLASTSRASTPSTMAPSLAPSSNSSQRHTSPERQSRDHRAANRQRSPSSRQHSPSKSAMHLPKRPTTSRVGSSDSLFDRYSGGLDYGWNKETRGFGGSAGTRSKGNEEERKEVPMGVAFGLDLSDVPVFLRRA